MLLVFMMIQAPLQAFAADSGQSAGHTGPVIENGMPADDSTVYTSMPTLSASLIKTGADIDPSTISVKLNETTVQHLYDPSTRTVIAATYLPNGTYKATIDVEDTEGNAAEQWSTTFEVVVDRSEEKVNYVALGDSLAVGVSHQRALGLSYTDMLAEELHGAGYLGEFNKSFAYPGYTTQQLLDALKDEMTIAPNGLSIQESIASADVITIDIGANDLLAVLDPTAAIDPILVESTIQQIAVNTGLILSEIKQLNDSADVYVMGLYNAFYNFPLTEAQKQPLEAILDSFNEAAETAVTSQGAAFISIKDAIAADYASYLPNPLNIHPSEEGYKAIADTFWNVMKSAYAWPFNSSLTARDITSTSLTLDWEEVNGGAAEYKVYKDAVEAATVTSSVYTATGLIANTEYSFKVEAKLPNGVWTTNGPTLSVKTATDSTYNPPSTGGGVVPQPRQLSISDLNNLIASSGTAADVTIDVANGGFVYLPGTAGEILQKANKGLILKSGTQSVTIPASVLNDLFKQGSGDEWKDARIKAGLQAVEAAGLVEAANAASDAAVKQNGKLYEFVLVLESKAGKTVSLSHFAEAVTLKFAITPTGFDKRLLGIYYLNEGSKQWEYVGGKVSGETIETALTHNSKYTVLEYSKSYLDVPSSHWAFGAIQELSALHVVNGMSSELFAPDRTTTRAQFVTMLVRTLGIESDQANTGFMDVAGHAWYAEAVAAAVQAGIVEGVSEHRFAPEATLTREQMALLLVRAYEYKSGKTLEFGDELEGYRDADLVSAWALEGVSKAIAAGLMQGQASDVFAPRGVTERAETAQGILNFLKK